MGTATAERVGLEVDAEELAEAHGLVSAAVSASKVLDHLRCVRLTAAGDDRTRAAAFRRKVSGATGDHPIAISSSRP